MILKLAYANEHHLPPVLETRCPAKRSSLMELGTNRSTHTSARERKRIETDQARLYLLQPDGTGQFVCFHFAGRVSLSMVGQGESVASLCGPGASGAGQCYGAGRAPKRNTKGEMEK